MQTVNYYYFSIFIILLFLSIQPVNAQCEWLYEHRDSELAIDTDGDGILNIDDDDIDDDGEDNWEDDDIDGDGIDNEYDMFPEGLQSYIIEDDGTIVLFYCENMLDTIYPPTDPEYYNVHWEYIIENDTDGNGIFNNIDPDIDGDGIDNDVDNDIDGDGVENDVDVSPNGNTHCEDWDWMGNPDTWFLSLDSNDHCLDSLVGNRFTITFTGIIDPDDPTQNDVCEFDIEFFESPNPEIDIQGSNENAAVTICEEAVLTDGFILTATGMGTNPSSEYIDYQWYLEDDPIEGETNITLDVSNINYNVNGSNIFSLKISNFCSYGEPLESDARTIVIYEGYGDECDPCKWYFPDYEANEFFLFTPNNDGVADYFPEAPNNEYNRAEFSEDTQGLSQPTCEATIYRLSIYNRLGRELFTSDYDNHPWDGKLKNGKICKDGTYFYKIEYILNPHISDYDQDKTQVATGTIHLDSGN